MNLLAFPQLAILFLFCFCLFDRQEAGWEGLSQDAFKNKFKTGVEKKFYFYDDKGSLNVNGSVAGISPPIIMDFKKYYPTCTSNVYFTFIYRASFTTGNSSDQICQDGMTICYEGQLIGKHMRPEFNVSNVDTAEAKKLIRRCHESDKANRAPTLSEYESQKRRPSPGARYLNIAVKTVKNLALRDIRSNEKGFLAKIGHNRASTTWHFFVISASFFKQKYYFISPEDGALVFQIGDRKDLGIKIIDSDGKNLRPVTFTHNGESFGTTENFDAPPDAMDMNNGGNFRHNVGLWMFYLDFKTNYHSWQAISTVRDIHDSQCKMQLEIRGNRMRPCRTYYEDIAILEPADTKITMTYTAEVGKVREQKYGQEDLKATETRWKKEQMQSSTTIDKQQDTTENKDIDEEELREVSEKEKSTTTTRMEKGEFSMSANIPLPGGFKVGGGGGYSYEDTTTEFNSQKDVHEKSNIDKTTETMFSDTTRSSATMESFKSTSGAAESMSQAEFLGTSRAFTSREAVDVKVVLPPNRKVIIKQMMFDCDGNLVKLPLLVYTDGVEQLNLEDNLSGPRRSRPLKASWNNVTLGMDQARITASDNGTTTAKVANGKDGGENVNKKGKEPEENGANEQEQLIADYENGLE